MKPSPSPRPDQAAAPGGNQQAPIPVLLKDLETTPELRDALESWRQHLGLRQVPFQDEEELKLQFYYGGQDVASVRTPQGRAVVASGTSEEVAGFLRQLSREERARVTLIFPEPWGVVSLPGVEGR